MCEKRNMVSLKKKIRVALELMLMLLLFLAPITKIRSLAASNLSTATTIGIGSTISETLANSQASYYKFTLNRDACVKLYAKTGGHNQNVYISVLNSSGNTMKAAPSFGTNDDANQGFQSGTDQYALNAGNYFIKIITYSTGGAKYSLNLTTTATAGGSVVIGGQKSNYLSTAQYFTLGNTLKSVAYCAFNGWDWDSCHYYKFSIPATQTVRFNVVPDFGDNTGSMAIYLLDSNAKRITSLSLSNKNGERSGLISRTLNAGIYYLDMTSFNSPRIPYTIATSVVQTSQPAQPSQSIRPTRPSQSSQTTVRVSRVAGVKASSPAKKKLRISWKKGSYSGYQVQCSRNRAFTQIVKSRTIAKKYKSYTLSGLKRKARYYVRVRAYKYANGRKVYSAWSSVKGVKIK